MKCDNILESFLTPFCLHVVRIDRYCHPSEALILFKYSGVQKIAISRDESWCDSRSGNRKRKRPQCAIKFMRNAAGLGIYDNLAASDSRGKGPTWETTLRHMFLHDRDEMVVIRTMGHL